MKSFKETLRFALVLAGTITIIRLSGELHGFGLLGVLSGYLPILIFSIWLIISSNRKNNTSNKIYENSINEIDSKIKKSEISINEQIGRAHV